MLTKEGMNKVKVLLGMAENKQIELLIEYALELIKKRGEKNGS